MMEAGSSGPRTVAQSWLARGHQSTEASEIRQGKGRSNIVYVYDRRGENIIAKHCDPDVGRY